MLTDEQLRDLRRWLLDYHAGRGRSDQNGVIFFVQSLLTQARAEEREALAKIGDEMVSTIKYASNRSPEHHVCQYVAAIRARKDE